MLSSCKVGVLCEKGWLTVKSGLGSCTGALTNSVDPDQTPLNAASDQNLNCFLKVQIFKG